MLYRRFITISLLQLNFHQQFIGYDSDNDYPVTTVQNNNVAIEKEQSGICVIIN